MMILVHIVAFVLWFFSMVIAIGFGRFYQRSQDRSRKQ